MQSRLFSIFLFSLSLSVYAEETEKIDYCHDDKINQDWTKRVAEFPNDPIILKLAGLREGLCLMIDRGQITHEQGTDIWEDERQRSIVDRGNEDSKKAPKFTL